MNYWTLIAGRADLATKIVEFFTAQVTNPDLFKRIQDFRAKDAIIAKYVRDLQFLINLKMLTIWDFMMFESDYAQKSGIPNALVDTVLQLMVEKRILFLDSMLQRGQRAYSVNEAYVRFLDDRDCLDNTIFGFHFMAEKYKDSIFKVSIEDQNGDQHSHDWQTNDDGRRNPGYNKSLEHIHLIEREGYRLMTFPMIQRKLSNGKVKIKSIVPVLSLKKLDKRDDSWWAVEPDEAVVEPLAEELTDPEEFVEGAQIKVTINAYERNAKARAACIEMQPRSNSTRSRIRRSTENDVRAIHAWLLDQETRNVPDTFLCNWELTKRQHEDGKLLVYLDGASGQAVAYQWGSLVHPGILEVRQDMRGRGIASKLVRHRIRQAYRRNQCILVIQCKPSSSIQFWQRMGFILFDSKMGENFAYRILQKKLRLPSNGLKIDVAIRFFPEERKRDKKISAYSVATPNAVQTSDGTIHFVSPVTSKPASRGRMKTSHSEARCSYQVS